MRKNEIHTRRKFFIRVRLNLPVEDLSIGFSVGFVTSARFYQETMRYDWQPAHTRFPIVEPITGLSLFEHDLPPVPLDWTSGFYNLAFQNVRDSGGHFGAAEAPEAVLEDMRTLFRPQR